MRLWLVAVPLSFTSLTVLPPSAATQTRPAMHPKLFLCLWSYDLWWNGNLHIIIIIIIGCHSATTLPIARLENWLGMCWLGHCETRRSRGVFTVWIIMSTAYFCKLYLLIPGVVQGRKMYQLVDMFALPEMTLYANVIQVSVHFLLNVFTCWILMCSGVQKSFMFIIYYEAFLLMPMCCLSGL